MQNNWLADDENKSCSNGICNDATEIRSNQLTLSGILWVTTALAMLLGYAARLGQEAIWQAVAYTVFVLVCGTTIGTFQRDWKNALFWGGLYAMLAFLAVAGGRLPHPSIALGWGLVGAAVGSCVGTNLPKNFLLGMITSAVLGWLAMAIVVLAMKQPLSGMIAFDTLVAALVGALLKPFTLLLQWFDRESRQPRFVLASWLAISVLIGNFLVPILGGVQR
jgi:hypothetical protein